MKHTSPKASSKTGRSIFEHYLQLFLYFKTRSRISRRNTNAISFLICVFGLYLPPVSKKTTASSFTAKWSSVSGATGYRLDVSTSSSFVTYVPGYQNLDVGNVTNRNVTSLAATTFYYYRLRAYNGNGPSPNSNILKAKTKSR